MKLSAYKALLAECPRTAMFFDLTERFPRGPKAALRPRDYKVTVQDRGWSGDRVVRIVGNEAFVGGEDGYSLEQLHKLASTTWYDRHFENLRTCNPEASLGGPCSKYTEEDGTYELTGEHRVFKWGAQVTRRRRAFDDRMRQVRKIVEYKSAHNLYKVRVGRCSKPVYMFADNETTAKMQYELLLSTAFNSAAARKGIDKGYSYHDDSVDAVYNFAGPSNGVHEIMEHNEKFTASLRAENEQRLLKIEELKIAIVASEELAEMVNMFTINSCAQATGEEE